jgi:hypothetical protein
MSATRPVALAVGVLLVTASVACAQTVRRDPYPRRGSIEAGGGGAWTQGFDIAPARAQLSRSTPGDPFDLFSTESRLDPATGGYVRLGVYLTSAVAVEAGVRYGTPTLAIRLFGDAESAPEELATATVSQYVFEGAVVWHATRAAFAGGRGMPFLSAGGGHIRELHEGDELVETGRQFHVSAGLKYLSGRGRRSAGLRGEVGISSREGGVRRDEGRQATPFALAGVTFLF